MKIIICMCTLCLLCGLRTFSQEINRLDNGLPVGKGKITLKDGKSVKFKNLTLQNGLIRYSDIKGGTIEKSSSEVFKITKTGTYAGWGALLGGLTGLVACLSATSGMDPNPYSYDPYHYSSPTSGVDLTAGQWIIITGGGAAFGGLIGLCFKREQTVFKNNAALSFYPSVNSTINGNYYPTLSLRINLK